MSFTYLLLHEYIERCETRLRERTEWMVVLLVLFPVSTPFKFNGIFVGASLRIQIHSTVLYILCPWLITPMAKDARQ